MAPAHPQITTWPPWTTATRGARAPCWGLHEHQPSLLTSAFQHCTNRHLQHSLYMHARNKSTCNKIPCTPFQAKRVPNTRAGTACDKVPHCALCTGHQAHAAMLHVRTSSHPCRSPRPPLRRREAPPQWWAGWAGLQVHGNMQVRNKIAGHVLGTWTGGCPKEQFFPIHTWHEHSPAHPQESTKLATS